MSTEAFSLSYQEELTPYSICTHVGTIKLWFMQGNGKYRMISYRESNVGGVRLVWRDVWRRWNVWQCGKNSSLPWLLANQDRRFIIVNVKTRSYGVNTTKNRQRIMIFYVVWSDPRRTLRMFCHSVTVAIQYICSFSNFNGLLVYFGRHQTSFRPQGSNYSLSVLIHFQSFIFLYECNIQRGCVVYNI